jgi:hypothetical protein|tara:strand:- start:248 stop:460 length:213 start_codon:yes stop_codon:yes gene_type:complete
MYRIVKETNQLTGRVQYIIERYANYFFYRKWTRDLNIGGVSGNVGGFTLEEAQRKLAIIKSGEITTKEVV